jgi:hypothetical protein
MRLVDHRGFSKLGEIFSAPTPDTAPEPLQVTCGPLLCQLHVWNEAEWAALAPADRPLQYVHAPGLGWVGAVAVECMN